MAKKRRGRVYVCRLCGGRELWSFFQRSLALQKHRATTKRPLGAHGQMGAPIAPRGVVSRGKTRRVCCAVHSVKTPSGAVVAQGACRRPLRCVVSSATHCSHGNRAKNRCDGFEPLVEKHDVLHTPLQPLQFLRCDSTASQHAHATMTTRLLPFTLRSHVLESKWG